MLNINKLTVSVIIPCFKQAQYLPDALNSVLVQTYSDWECIIVNDGSPDNTKEIALEWVSRDSRFKYLEQENKGLSEARNHGIKKSTGKYILPLDADDKIGSKYLELAVKEFENDPSLKLVYCEAEYFGDKTGKWELPSYNFKSLLEFNMIFCSALFKRVDFNNTRGYSKEFKEGFEDWNFWLDLLTPYDNVMRLPQTQFYYRIREESRTKSLDINIKKRLRNQVFANHINAYNDHDICATDIISLRRQYEDLINSKHYKLGYFLLHPIAGLKGKLVRIFEKK